MPYVFKYIACCGSGLAACLDDFINRNLSFLNGEIAYHYRSSGSRENLAAAFADTVAATGDNGHFVRKVK